MSKQKKTLFRGAATALITPFSSGRIDFDAMGKLIERQIAAGIKALVIAGTTGESATLTDAEKIALFAFAAERIQGRVPLIAGVGCADTAHTVALSRSACAAGADALLIVTPYYNRPSQAGLRAHYETIADNSDKPIVIYSVPGRTGVTVSTDTYIALSDHPNIIAVKEASTDMGAISALIDSCGNRLDVYAGNDDLTVPICSLGGMGIISVISNIVPAAVADICRLWFDGKPRLAAARSAKYHCLSRALFADTNPVPVKAALAMMGLCREEFRLPLVSPCDEVRERIRLCMKDLKLIAEV
ncbi:MAG: 4-hydroxy-tetrahydrodipicolinate synthase [Clostridia bacterium]|nr:4-hydroxy-tetrahydrodipicolinate synthase [Clostridia bacterium]